MNRRPLVNRQPLRERAAGVLGSLLRTVQALALVAAVAGAGFGAVHLYRKYDVPVAVIGVDGELDNVSTEEVEAIVADNLGGGFLSLDLETICAGLEAHPWVATASARRKWPNQVVISLEEEVPIARWGGHDFLNNKGKILQVGEVALSDSLPYLDGPKGEERRVMQQYRNFSQMLASSGLRISEFRLAPRGNWELSFERGIHLVVGKEPVAAKVQRFLLVWERSLKARSEAVERVDIRYGNGVAVNWKQGSENAIAARHDS